jgi:TPR repeat protein
MATTKKLRPWLIWTGIILALFEGGEFIHWLAFTEQSRPFDWKEPIVIVFWIRVVPLLVTPAWEWLAQLDARLKRIEALLGGSAKSEAGDEAKVYSSLNARLRNIETMLEAHYKWGTVYAVDDEEDTTDREREKEDLDDETRAKIAEYEADIESGEDDSYNLGVTYWNLAMDHARADGWPRTVDGRRKELYWLRKAARVGYHRCEHTLGEVYEALEEYDKAMLWYRKAAKRGGRLVRIAESSIADMYAEGKGVLQNHAEAARWWTMAAQHGWKWANYALGKLYAEGAEGVPQDDRAAYFHLCVTTAGDGLECTSNQYAFDLRDKVAKRLSVRAISEEQKRADEWLLRYADPRDRKVAASQDAAAAQPVE